MDVDSPSTQSVTAASEETKPEIRENKRQKFMQWREELRKLVKNIPYGLLGLADDITYFEGELGCDIYAIENEHQTSEECYKSALEEFKKRWDNAKRMFEQSVRHHPQQPAEVAAANLYGPVEEFMTEIQTLQQAFEVEINHPEVSFKKDLNNLRERLGERQETCLCLKEKLDETMEKLDNACKRVVELQKLTEQ
ncbi:hypothetical protein GGI42DRAFT_361564 [Trichoderma sp. SZMC 28013]